ncbi:MAG: SIMPL domain-containing protein [Spirochaetales bacterium]|nr:SIMPL domain-containing protein [Spirochaetales bacterium]
MKKLLPLLISVLMLLASCASVESVKATVSVTASSYIEVDPDIAYFRIAAEKIESSTEKARIGMNELVNGAVGILIDEFGIKEDAITTEYLSFNPYYEWINGERVDKGYRASQSIKVTLEDLELIGKIIDALSSFDGVSVSSIEFARKASGELEDQARKLAVKEAERKASEYASGAGMKLGRVISISDGTTYSQAKYANTMMYATESAAASGSTSYYEGKVSVSDRVTVVYALED